MATDVDHAAEIARIFADPLQRLQGILARDEQRLEAWRHDITGARQALLQLVASVSRPEDTRGTPVWEVVSAELAPALLQHLLASATDLVRSCVLSLDVGPGLDRATIEQGLGQVREGRYRQRTLYPMDVMEDSGGRDWVRTWAEAGEEQRLSLAPPSDFAIFDDEAVVAVATWGDPAADYVLIREPMVVAAFATLFDRSSSVACRSRPSRGAGTSRGWTYGCSGCWPAGSRTSPSPATSGSACGRYVAGSPTSWRCTRPRPGSSSVSPPPGRIW